MVSYDDLPQEAQDAFDEAMSEFSDSATERNKQKYVDGIIRAVQNDTYAEGLADRFNMDASDFSSVASDWSDSVGGEDGPDPEEWEQALSRAGIDEKFRDNLVTGLTE